MIGKTGISRRRALKAGAGATIAVSVGGCIKQLTARDAQDVGITLQTLSDEEAAVLAALGETLVPGARDAGMVPYVDSGLTADVADCLLMIRYLDVPGPFAPFYKSGLAALQRFALRERGNRFDALGAYDQADIVRAISASQPDGWSDDGAPPAPFFYFALRGDAIDVTWGTMDGFETFDQPYLAHIEPVTTW
jgi:hypothetical protein